MSSNFGSTINSNTQNPKGGFSNSSGGTAISSSIAKTIGEGENAKNSVVWKVITYTFYMYSAIIAILIVNDICRYGGINCVDIAKETWSTYSPILTLSLGYMFGKKDAKE
ncbi:hypothetical protein [Pantoea agglomerans]|nr:hypothetical protein [Pantoea agglomerans]MCH9408891.1 hypothetical protein [Pantoea agglomerans]WNK33443.1 hypothetical protein RM157_23755 [Pantoea agglomerans]